MLLIPEEKICLEGVSGSAAGGGVLGAEELVLEKKKLLAKELILLRREGVSGSEASEEA